MTSDPAPPTGVRLILDDETEVPVDCIYDGMIDDTHRWIAPVPAHCHGRVVNVSAATWPARTGLRLAAKP